MLSTLAYGMNRRLGWGLGQYTEGVCKEGADFKISDVNLQGRSTGVFSARPCTYAVLEAFKELQNQINRVIIAKRLPVSLLVVDGRIGEKTTFALGQAAKSLSAQMAVPPAIRDAIQRSQSDPASQDAMRAVATMSDEVTTYAKQGADMAGAPATSPEPGIPRGDVTTAVLPDQTIIEVPTAAAPRKRKGAFAIGMLGLVAGVGIISAAHYYTK